MTREQIREYVARDWRRIAAAKTAHWRRRKQGRPASTALAIAEALRDHVRALRPDWPSPRERGEDLESHRRVAEALRAVARAR